MGACTAIALALSHPALSTDVNTCPPIQIAQSWSCQPRKTCGKIGSCEEAEWYLENCNWGVRLDGDSDGAPCEKLCGSNN